MSGFARKKFRPKPGRLASGSLECDQRAITSTARNSSIRPVRRGSRFRPFRACCSSGARPGRRVSRSRRERPPALDGAAAVVTFIGHATFLIQTAAGNILTDPMYSERAGPLRMVGPRRVRQPALRFDSLPPISTVLLSHNHYDHCDLQTLRGLAERFDPMVVTPLGNAALVRSAGIRRVEELDWWQEAKTAGVADHADTGASFLRARPVRSKSRAVGRLQPDRGSHPHLFRRRLGVLALICGIRHRIGPIDLALLPIGAYEPRWFMQAVHMNPAEAVQAHLDLGAPESIGMHFGTFQLTTEGIDEPLRALEDARAARGVPPSRFRTLDFGESIRLS